ncbi:MAG TPA: zf-HC2 domain-containing protein [Acidimicrobiales bacterium]|nr:zf-HC2 domain-containing protein [Acidimicrobiales bacterium]
MDCTFYREAISARIDGEDDELESAALDAHLAGCPRCRSWAEAALLVTRTARVTPAEPVPDLSVAIMAALAATDLRARRESASPIGVARFGLALVALAQLCLAVPALRGQDGGAPIHVAHEQGSWLVALAVGLLVVAWRPARAAAMLPLVGALAVALVLTMAADIAAGRTQAAAEAPHGLAFLGLGLLWVLAYPVAGRRRRSPARPV